MKSDVQSQAILQTFMAGFFSVIKTGHLMLQDTVTCNLTQLLVQWYTDCTSVQSYIWFKLLYNII